MDDFPEFETYADVIDAYERDDMGYKTLTDYIKGNNIKIKEIDISPLSDLKNMRDGGPVGIEILFTEKVPAAPSQLVSESDILLGYRGDDAARSDRASGRKSGRADPRGGVDRSAVSEGSQYARNVAAQNNRPSFKEKVKSFVTNPAVQTLGGAVLTGGINTAFPGVLDKLNKARLISNAIKYGKDIAIEDELENIVTQGGISPYADGGRVGLFMGGPALEGTALNIYNSMNAYGFSDQEIANALTERGLYTPPGSDSGTPPPQASQTLGYQGGDDKPMIRPVKKDPRVGAAFEAYQRNQGLKAMGIEDPFADEMSLQGAYYGDMPDVDLSPGKQTLGGKLKSGIGQAMNFPLVKGISMMTPFGLAKQGLTAIKSLLPVNQRGIAENIAGNMGVAVDDIGRIVNTGNYQDPENVMAGYNLNKLTDESFDKRIGTISETLKDKYNLGVNEIKGILEGTLSDEQLADINSRAIMPGTNKTTNLIKQLRSINIAKDRNKFIQDAAKKEADRQREIKEAAAKEAAAKEAAIAAEMARYNITSDSDFGGGTPGGGGGNVRTTGGDVYGGSAYGYNEAAEKTDYYRDGGLATMFRNKR